jgi:DNA polymerase III delta prime subunit
LSNIQSDVLHRDEVPRLVEEWLRATERRFEIELALGRCRQVLSELRPLASSHPGHERFAELLVEALYRVGRTSEALAQYRAVRRYLADELGVAPGRSLQRLELAILRGDELGGSNHRLLGGSPVALSVAPSLVEHDELEYPLPGDLADFVGRSEETGRLAERLLAGRSGPAIVVISGPPGIGKTALAVHVAHTVAAKFSEAGVMFWSFADGAERRRIDDGSLLILDGVTDAHAVASMLPSSRNSALLITSRMALTGLAATYGAFIERLGPLQCDDSREMLTSVVGISRAAAEPASVDAVASLCGHFPLALRIVATRLLLRPRQGFAELVEWLHDDPVGKLSLSADPEMSVSARFADFVGRLDRQYQLALRTISVHLESYLSLDECAAALQLPRDEAAVVVDRLIEANVIESDERGRYQVPSLLRAFVRGTSGDQYDRLSDAGELAERTRQGRPA